MDGFTGINYNTTNLPGNILHFPNSDGRNTQTVGTNETLITDGPIVDFHESAAFGIYIYPIVVLIAFSSVGLIGNCFVLYIFIWKWERTKTAVFIITLAALDITNCSLIMPIEVYILSKPLSFDFPDFCKVARCLSYVVTAAYSFVLVAVAFDRYLMVCKPLKRMTLGRRYATRTCIGAIVLAIMTQWPSSFLYGTFTFKLPATLPTNQNYTSPILGNVTDNQTNVFVIGKTCLVTNYYYYTNRLPTLLFQGFLFFGHVIIFITLAVVYIVIGRKLFISSHVNIEDRGARQGLLRASIVSALTGNVLGGVRSARVLKCYSPTSTKDSEYFQPGISDVEDNTENIANGEKSLSTGNRKLTKSLTALSTGNKASRPRRSDTNEDNCETKHPIRCISGPSDTLSDRRQSAASICRNTDRMSQRVTRSFSLDMSKLHSVVDGRSPRSSGDIKELSIRRNTLIMRMVTFTFILSYLPFLILVTLRYSNDSVPSKLGTKAKIVYHVFLRSYFLNSVIRPFIYIVMNEQYRLKLLAALSFTSRQ